MRDMRGIDVVYRNEIKPMVERITVICKQLAIPAFMTFQDSSDTFVTTSVNESKSAFDRIKLHRLVNASWSVDDLMNEIIEDAKENGHNSEWLSRMNIPKKPSEEII